jgi:ribosomal protein S27E
MTPFEWSDCKKYVTRTVHHHYFLANAESEIKGIYKQVYSSTVCPRCREQVKFVRPWHKVKCDKCNLWMAATELPRPNWFNSAVSMGDLIIWDEMVSEPTVPNSKPRSWWRFWERS